jgi:hypothetical protein
MGQDEVGHVIEGEGPLDPLRRDFPGGKKAAGIIDQNVDARLGRRDFRADPFYLAKQRKVGVIGAMCSIRSDRTQRREGLIGPALIARNHHDAGAEPSQSFRCALPDSRGGPGDHDDLPPDRRLLSCDHRSCCRQR